MMNRKRAGALALFGAVLGLLAVEPAAAQSTYSSTTDAAIQGLNSNLIYVAVPITILVEGILIYTVWKYRKTEEAKPTQENRRLEITWTIATAIILLFVGVASYQVLGNPYVAAESQNELPGDAAEEIEVYGQKYNWNFVYRNVSVDGASATDVALTNASIEGATVENVTDEGIVISGGSASSATDGALESASLVNGTVTAGAGNASQYENRTGETVTFSDVTVSGAAVEDATISDATIQSTNTMVMPNERNVRLNITSRDWLHSFHVPELGLKTDALPGQSNYLVTKAQSTGEYQLYCAEYCGVGHSGMLGSVDVRSQEDYDSWLAEQWFGAQG
ncbi:cytochrome c oxidase subunit II [Halorientalis sp. IM1011]|uniref:cytochrome c oxidase subunit II n=1 Tax=Halorientalis sp. IM1011 TaxID=1932360 RepID=UPI00097CCC12|nr:cytochrome c oxidase subunit II [Halorientalis sp. IM1011]